MMERRPRMLKDFLAADDSSPCSFSGFNSVPRRLHSPPPPPPLRRSRSRAAASSTISAILAAVKRFHSLKSPAAILPRSLSRRRSRKEDRSHEPKKLTVTIKDIIRWRSFRDPAEDESPAPLVFDSALPPGECTAASLSSSTATTTTSSTPCSSSGSSWCDSDFSAEELAWWDGNSHNSGKKFYGRVGVGKEEEIRKSASAISVVDVFEDGSGGASCRWLKQKQLGKAAAAAAESEMRGAKQVAKWEEDSEVKERMAMAMAMARQLVEHVKATTTTPTSVAKFDKLLLGFFTEALLSSSDQLLGSGQLNKMIEEAESWIINGQNSSSCGGLALQHSWSWSWGWNWRRREEQDLEEEAVGIQTWITNLLVHEILDDLFSIIPQ